MAGIQPGWGSQWETLANAITNYYGGNVGYSQYEKVVQMLNSGSYTMDEMESILAQIPEFERTYNANGELIKVAYKESTNAVTSTASSVAQEVNSNVSNATQTQFSTVQTITKDAQTGKVTVSDNVTKYNSGTATSAKAVASSVVQGVAAASVGITLGKTIDQLAYDSGFNWLSWAGVDMESLNPESWAGITAGDDSFGAKLFNFVFQIDTNTGDPQAYIDENTFAYMVAYMIATGAIESGGDYEWDGIAPVEFNLTDPIYYKVETFEGTSVERPVSCYYFGECLHNNVLNILGFEIENNDDTKVTSGVYNNDVIGLKCSKEPFTMSNFFEFNPSTMRATGTGVSPIRSYTYDNKTVYYSTGGFGPPVSSFGTASDNFAYETRLNELAWVLQYGNFIPNGVEGIGNQPNSKQFDSSGISDYTDIAAILLALQNQFPELWDNRIEVSPDGENIIKYIPVGFPTGGTGQNPTTNGATQSDLAPKISDMGDNVTDELIKTLIDIIQNPMESGGMESDTTTPTKPVDPNGDPRGTGENPPIITPVGSASALWKIYNPSQSQLDSFGAWLWSSDFVDQLLKLFNDPMQAIIGLHKVYCTPPTSGSGPIKVGYLVSDANANYVSSQYTEIDCGEIDLQEHFGNVFDYDGFTRVSVFLPFIGFRDLDTKDVMRGKMNIKYGIDVLTGACLAKITITRDLNSPILYTFEGNCAVQYPVSSGSYMGIVASLAAVVGNIAGTIATGGAIAPLTITGSVSALMNAHTKVERSGNVSSNVGALGPKKPYIVIQRPQTQMPQNGVLIEGKGQNETVSLGTLTGYVKVKKADLMGIPATGSELDEIRDLLEGGIYMN